LREGHGEKVVDVAAARLIVQEAGGVVRDINGNEFDISLNLSAKRPTLAAATPELMDEIVATIHV
jgi:myo-inositol-1(or 4)-monophosphatase